MFKFPISNQRNQVAQCIDGTQTNGSWNRTAGFLLILIFVAGRAFASGGELGDEGCELVRLLTGKWLFSLTILAIIGTGSALLFGSEMSDTLKKVCSIIFVAGLMVSAPMIVAYVFKSFGGMTC